MISVGLTGGIACGKSTVAGLLREAGVPVLDLDQVSRAVMAPGEEAVAEIAARWPQAVGRDGEGRLAVDRKALGAAIVADPEGRRALEAMIHPRVWARSAAWLEAQAAAGARSAAVEAALMVETGSWRRFDRLLVVSCSPEVQARRLRAREGYSEAQAAAWLAAQAPLAVKEAAARSLGARGAVIHNDDDDRGPDGSPGPGLREAVRRAWEKLIG